MIKSLRWRLRIWYSVLLLAVVSGFAAIIYYRTCTSKLQEIDAALEAGARYLEDRLRPVPEPVARTPLAPPLPWRLGPKGPKLGPPNYKAGFQPTRFTERFLETLVLPRELNPLPGTPDDGQPYCAVWRGDGTVLKATRKPEDLPAPHFDENSDFTRPRVVERGNVREAWMKGPDGTWILVGKPIAGEWAALHSFGWQLAGIGAGVLALGLLGAYGLAVRISRPLAAMSVAASTIRGTNLSARIDAGKMDAELAELARTLNAMLDRVQDACTRHLQYTAAASRELDSPLSVLRSHVDLALSQPRSADAYRQALESCKGTVDQMTTVVQGLLTLAKADGANPDLQVQSVSLEQVLTDCIKEMKPLAEEKSVTISAETGPVVVAGDPASLKQVVDNLLSNAIQFNRSGGRVHVQLHDRTGEPVLMVTDTGPGIPEQDTPRIFERFFRVDKDHTGVPGGHGLGLAVCKCIVEAHGGLIDFETRVQGGTTFRVRFPQTEKTDATGVLSDAEKDISNATYAPSGTP